MKECSLGAPGADYDCRFCQVDLHRGDSGCPYSTLREEVCSYASVCLSCAAEVDRLTDRTTRLAKVHAAIVYEAQFKFARFDD